MNSLLARRLLGGREQSSSDGAEDKPTGPGESNNGSENGGNNGVSGRQESQGINAESNQHNYTGKQPAVEESVHHVFLIGVLALFSKCIAPARGCTPLPLVCYSQMVSRGI